MSLASRSPAGPARPLRWRRGLLCLALAAGGGAASAAIVTTEVSFERFTSGALGADSLYVTRVNGVDLTPAGGNAVVPISTRLPAGTRSVSYATEIPGFFVPPTNGVSFTPRTPFEAPSLPVGTELLLGELSLRNGTWSAPLASIAFTVSVLVDGVAVGTWSDVLEHRSLIGTTPEENADSFGFRDHPGLGTVRVYEGGSAAVTLFGRIGSLVPSRFGNLTGDGFLATGGGGTVPLPGTAWLAAAALLAAGALRRRHAG